MMIISQKASLIDNKFLASAAIQHNLRDVIWSGVVFLTPPTRCHCNSYVLQYLFCFNCVLLFIDDKICECARTSRKMYVRNVWLVKLKCAAVRLKQPQFSWPRKFAWLHSLHCTCSTCLWSDPFSLIMMVMMMKRWWWLTKGCVTYYRCFWLWLLNRDASWLSVVACICAWH